MTPWEDNRSVVTKLADSVFPWRWKRKPWLFCYGDPDQIRSADKRARGAVLFVHGFGGDPRSTWGNFPKFISDNPRMSGWDIFSVGYPTRLIFDIVGLWSADPDLATVAKGLYTVTSIPPFKDYRVLALVAHSMGGLVVQRALLDHRDLRKRVSHVFLFGTPSGGLIKASLFAQLKQQLHDMSKTDEFITRLRARWDDEFKQGMPFVLSAVAGWKDQFVPPASALAPFSEENTKAIDGNHLQIVKPQSADDWSVTLVADALAEDGLTTGPESSAEMLQAHALVEKREKDADELDATASAELGRAMERIGRRDDAIKMLEQNVSRSTATGRVLTDLWGNLAGRVKRRWIQKGQEQDAKRAKQLYQRGYEASQKDPAQAFYHGINLAFMQLASDRDREAARTTALAVLEQCAAAARKETEFSAPPDPWRLATQAEAYLVNGDTAKAVEDYRCAVAAAPERWQKLSMYEQAILVVGATSNREAAVQLDKVFRTT